MRVKTDVTLAGGLAKAMQRLRKRLAPRAEAGLRAAADVLFEQAKNLVPVDTGSLRDSGDVRSAGNGLDAVFFIGFGWKDFVPNPKYPDRVRRPPFLYVEWVHQEHTQFLVRPARDIDVQTQMAQAFNVGFGL